MNENSSTVKAVKIILGIIAAATIIGVALMWDSTSRFVDKKPTERR